MLSQLELNELFTRHGIPSAGRILIHEARDAGPAREIQRRTDTVRTRYQSRKMGRPVLAESRTVELPAIVLYENDKSVFEYWPQPFKIDLLVEGLKNGRTRTQHVPDALLITETGFRVEEWREEQRLLEAAQKNPKRFYKDDAGRWHHVPAEEYLSALNIEYRLRSADELPRILVANLNFLADFARADAPPVPEEVATAIRTVVHEKRIVPHLALVHEHGFKADQIFQLVFAGEIYANLHTQRLDRVEELLLFRSETIYQAHALTATAEIGLAPPCELALRPGSRFIFDGRSLEVVLAGTTSIVARAEDKSTCTLPLALVEQLFRESAIEVPESARKRTVEYDVSTIVANEKDLGVAMRRLEAIRNPEGSGIPERTLRRYRQAIKGVTSVQDQLKLLAPRRSGNTGRRLPQAVLDVALEVVDEHHNQANRQPVSATYVQFKARCEERGLVPMSESGFYVWIKDHVDIKAREGRRAAYQQAPIPLWYDHEQPVHGVRPHAVVYIDHTTVNQLCRGMEIENLGKPYLTIAFDGAVGKARAMYLSYDAPSANTVLMILRDYVRRNGRLPDTIVLDNGAEFHSAALKRFCDLFRVHIRWRRRSKPRDSTLVERMLGVTETEVIAAQDGNTRCLKNPRMVSAEVHPENFIRWTLPALHGSIEYFLFDLHPDRKHPRFGVSPNDRERRLLVELGSRDHVIVRYDETFRLLTASHSGNKPMRVVDRQRGVFVDGMHYWHECLAKAKPKEEVEVRVEMWCARVVYVCFRENWVIAQARDGGRLDGRFRHEYEIAKRTENRERRTRAQQARRSSAGAHRKQELWIPERWDPRLREQAVEAYNLYSRLGMTEAFAGARSTRAGDLALACTAVASAPKQESTAGTTSTQQLTLAPAKAPKPADGTSSAPTPRGADVPEAKPYSYF